MLYVPPDFIFLYKTYCTHSTFNNKYIDMYMPNAHVPHLADAHSSTCADGIRHGDANAVVL